VSTTADVLAKCRNDYLLTGGREQRNKLAGAIDASVTSMSFLYDLAGLASGAKVSVGLEDVHVWDTNTSAKTATVQRGDFGSAPAAHAVGDLVTVNSRFSDAQILRAVNDELAALSSPSNGLYRMRSVDLTYNASLNGYDMVGVTNVLSIWQLRYKATGSEKDWPLIGKDLFKYQRDLSTSEFASGQAVFIHDYAQPGNAVRVWYRAPFDPLVTVTDNVATVTGLHAEAHDLLSIGAAIRLTAGREIKRNFDESQGDTRRADEVPPGAQLGGMRALMAYRKMRLGEEAQRLANLYPVRI